MTSPEDKFTRERVITLRRWTDSLISFRLTRHRGFRFVAGQFARLGVIDEEGQTIWRAFSMVSAPYDEHLEFFAIAVPGGAFSARLCQLAVGDEIQVDKQAFGFLTTDRFQPGQDLWMLATGTGLAPFLSILQEPGIWEDYAHVVLVHSVRTVAELSYQAELAALDQHPLIGGQARKLIYLPVVTREPAPAVLDERLARPSGTRTVPDPRIPVLIASGALERRAGLRLTPDDARVMICGNPDMVRDTRNQLKTLGFALARRAEPGQYAVENAF